jgi:hypothetical protein
MALCPTTWVAPTADGGLEVFVVGTDHGGSESLWHWRQPPPALAGRIGSRMGLHQIRTGCAGPGGCPQRRWPFADHDRG